MLPFLNDTWVKLGPVWELYSRTCGKTLGKRVMDPNNGIGTDFFTQLLEDSSLKGNINLSFEVIEQQYADLEEAYFAVFQTKGRDAVCTTFIEAVLHYLKINLTKQLHLVIKADKEVVLSPTQMDYGRNGTNDVYFKVTAICRFEDRKVKVPPAPPQVPKVVPFTKEECDAELRALEKSLGINQD